jgi:hypothetical protein
MNDPTTPQTKELHHCFNEDEHANIHATYELIIGENGICDFILFDNQIHSGEWLSVDNAKAYATEEQLKTFIGENVDERFRHGIFRIFEKYSKMDNHHEPKVDFVFYQLFKLILVNIYTEWFHSWSCIHDWPFSRRHRKSND